MTREEAIEVINSLTGKDFPEEREASIKRQYQIAEALMMGIEALKKQKRGKWVIKIEEEHTDKYDARTPHWYCGECGKEYYPQFARNYVNYCYGCGAKMEVEG